MANTTPYIGSKISLISKAEIRYQGTLYKIDTDESTVTLSRGLKFGMSVSCHFKLYLWLFVDRVCVCVCVCGVCLCW